MSRQIFETRLPTEQGIKRLERAKRLITQVTPEIEICHECQSEDDVYMYFRPITPDAYARPLQCWIECTKCGQRAEVRPGAELAIFNWNQKQRTNKCQQN